MENLKGLLSQVRACTPLVHFMTNYVTVNDCANVTLACGGSPVMADEISEVGQITALCSALVINIGTANDRTLTAMLHAGRRANELGLPILLDPVGAGASEFRNNAVLELLREINFTAIKGNISEIKFLSHGITSTQGVDAAETDLIREETLREAALFSQKLSLMTGSIIIITGPIDIVADREAAYAIRNGHSMMSKITGTGCMSGAVTACFLGANPERPLAAAVASIGVMGVCGELAYEKLVSLDSGTGTYRTLFIDAMSRLTDEILQDRLQTQRLF